MKVEIKISIIILIFPLLVRFGPTFNITHKDKTKERIETKNLIIEKIVERKTLLTWE